jgi:uncharacterized membrane protein (UPF0127 family)
MKLPIYWFISGYTLFVPLFDYTKTLSKWPKSLTIRISDNSCRIGPTFQVEVAQTEAERERGLSRRMKPLNDHEGMLFIWQKLSPGYFWMKDTWIPLSLIYFDESGKLISTYEMPVEQNPAEPKNFYYRPAEAKFALEIKGNTTEDLQLHLNKQLCISVQKNQN